MTLQAQMKWNRFRQALAVSMLAGLAGCGEATGKAETTQGGGVPVNATPTATVYTPEGTSSPVVATLGTVTLSAAEFKSLLAALPPVERQRLTADRAALDRVVQARLSEKALVQQARNQGWQEREEVRSMMDAAGERIVLATYLDSVSQAPDDYPSAAELEVAYEQNQAQLQEPPAYRVSQIFIAAPYGDADSVEKARRQAAELARRAAAPKADFAALAREFSNDPSSAERGGEIGMLPLSQIVPELRSVISGMQKGQVVGPVQLPAGFHVLKLTEVREARTLPLVEVQVQLRDALRSQRQQQAARAYLEGMVSGATFSVDGKALAAALD